MSSPDDSRTAFPRRRQVIGGAAAALVMLAVVVLGLFLRGSGEGSGEAASAANATSAAPSSSATVPTTAPVVPEPPLPSGDPGQLPPSLPAVAFDQEAAGEDGVTARVVSLDAVRGTAEGPGNIAGPALRVTVRLANGAAEPVDLGLVSVTMSSGAEATPASPLDDPSRAPFSGMLEPGGTAEGVYFFSVPEGDRDIITLTVGHRAGAPFLVFSGAAD